MARTGFGLATRIFLASAGIVTVVLGVALVVLSRSAQDTAETSVARGLATTEQRVRELVEAERGLLASRLQVYAQSPEYRASVESPESESDLLDYAQVAQQEARAEWVQLVGRDGIRLARSDDPSAPPVDLSGVSMVRDALDGVTAQGFGVAGDTAIINIVATPIFGVNERILGALFAAKVVTDSIARAVGQATESDVFFFVIDGNDEARIAGVTDRLRNVADSVLVSLASNVGVATEPDAGVRQAGGTEVARLQRPQIGGEHYVGRGALLLSASGNPVGGFVALRSLDRELAALGYTRLRNTLLAVGGAGLLVAILFAGVTSRQIVRPVTILANATQRAAEGDYQAEIPEGRAEIGTLASAFRRLLADLRDKQALVDFLSTAGGQPRTVSLTAVGSAPTVPMAAPGAGTAIAPGRTVGNRYRVLSVLGVGGMGAVYKAEDLELHEVLALKTLKPELMAMDASALERFKGEIRIARRIAHRNVVRTYDLGEITGQYFITMEYVEGKSLKDLIRERGRLPASAVLPIAKQLCRALEVSHEEGVIHRDIKPQNMVVQPDGVLKVMDFGIARLASRPPDAGQTQAGMVVGTPEYMAPEQLMGHEIDARADLYATGCVIYECLTGNVPITADSLPTLFVKVLDEIPPAPVTIHMDIPQALSDIVTWTLQKDRDRRPASAAVLREQLERVVA